MKKIFRILVLVAVVAIVVVVARRKLTGEAVAEGPLTLYGNIDIRQVNLGFRVDGRVESMDFEEGDPVAKGQVIATLDTGPLSDSLALCNAQAAVAEAAVKKLEAGTRPSEIAISKAQLEELRL